MKLLKWLPLLVLLVGNCQSLPEVVDDSDIEKGFYKTEDCQEILRKRHKNGSYVYLYENRQRILEGWVDDNTCRMIGEGTPKPNLSNAVQRKGTAREAALLRAQAKMLMQVQEDQGGAGSVVKGDELKKITGFVRGGRVLCERHYPGDVCLILYEVQRPNLKTLLGSGLKKP